MPFSMYGSGSGGLFDSFLGLGIGQTPGHAHGYSPHGYTSSAGQTYGHASGNGYGVSDFNYSNLSSSISSGTSFGSPAFSSANYVLPPSPSMGYSISESSISALPATVPSTAPTLTNFVNTNTPAISSSTILPTPTSLTSSSVPIVPVEPEHALVSIPTKSKKRPNSSNYLSTETKKIRAHRLADSKRRAKLSKLFTKLHEISDLNHNGIKAKPKQGEILQNAISEIDHLKERLKECQLQLEAGTQNRSRLNTLMNMLQQEINGGISCPFPLAMASLPSSSSPQLVVPLKDQKPPQQFEVNYKKRYRRHNGNGEIIPASVRTTLIPDSAGYIDMIVSRVTPLLTSGEDIETQSSQLKSSNGEGLLIASCAGLHLAMNLIPALFGSFENNNSIDLKLRYVDRFLCDLLGLEPQDCLKLTLGQISHPDDTLAVFKALCKSQTNTI